MKKRLFIIIAIVIVIITTIISIPYMLNSSLGKKIVLSKISGKTRYLLQADTIYFTWLGPQRAKGLIATSPTGIQYNCRDLALEMPLWELWKNTPSIGITHVSNVTVALPQTNGKSIQDRKVIDSAISAHKKCSQTNCCRIFGEIHVTDGKIYLNNPKDSIDIPELQYICNKGGMILHMNARFPDTKNISNLDIEYVNGAQNFWLQGRDIPSHLLVGSWNGFSMQEIIGSTLHIDSNIQLINGSGSAIINMYSPNISITQSGEIYHDRYVLDKPLAISMRISKKILDTIFHHLDLQIDPIQDPIIIIIQPQEILLPLSLSTEIKNGSIHIGKITCTNTNLLFQLATDLLQIDNPKIDIWFSEIPVTYANGILYIDRSEILLQNEYQIAIWGKIDCFQRKVRLTLGITESTLRKIFGLKSLPSDFMITCAIKGGFDDIQLDTAKLIKKLSILLTKEKAKKQFWREGSKFFQKESTNIPPPMKSLPQDNK